MVCGPMAEGVASKASKSSKGVGVGDASTTHKKVSKLVVGSDQGKRPVRERTRGVAGTKSVGSGSRLSESEQEVDPLRVSCSANKGEMLSEAPARFIIRWYAGNLFVSKKSAAFIPFCAYVRSSSRSAVHFGESNPLR